MKIKGLILLTACLLTGCEKKLPVEKTAQLWVEYYYNSDFEKAKQLSTRITKDMIDTLALELKDEGAIMPFKISGMNCLVNNDSAVCAYVYSDALDTFEEKVNLIHWDDSWLINEPLAGEDLSNEMVEQIFDIYEEMLKEEMQNVSESKE